MEKEIANGTLGTEARYDVDLNGTNVVLKADYDGKGANAGIYIEIEGEYLLDKLAEKIPGDVDDAVFDIIKAALKG